MPISIMQFADDRVRVELSDGAPGTGAELCEDLDLRVHRDAQVFLWMVEPFLPHLPRRLRRALMRRALRTVRAAGSPVGEEVEQ